MDFEELWLAAVSEQKDRADPQAPHVFSSADMARAHEGVEVSQCENEDAEYILLACKAASHEHNIELRDVRGHEGRDLTLTFPSFEGCCRHPMLSHLEARCVALMRNRCKSASIMTLSFLDNVSPTGRFIVTPRGTRVTGTNLEEDRILCVTHGPTCVSKHDDPISEDDPLGPLHRLMLNSCRGVRRRLAAFRCSRCDNVSRSAVLALLRAGEHIAGTVDNLVTAAKAGVPASEVVWTFSGAHGGDHAVVTVAQLREIGGLDDAPFDAYHRRPGIDEDNVAELVLTAAHRQIVGRRTGCPPRANMQAERNCLERRLLDYFKQTILNNPSKPTLYAMRAAALEALVLVSGLRPTLQSLVTSSLAEEMAAEGAAEFYGAMQLDKVLGLEREELEEFSRPLGAAGNKGRTHRTRFLIKTACARVTSAGEETVLGHEEVLHDPDVLHRDYVTGNLELDLLRISDHLTELSTLINNDTEIRMLNLLVIGAELIGDKLEKESSVNFYGLTITGTGDGGICVTGDEDLLIQFPNLCALNGHIDVFGTMISFMLGGSTDDVIDVKAPALCIPERTLFVRNTLRRLQEAGLSRSQAIETAVATAKVLAVRRGQEFERKVLVDADVMQMLERVRGCLVEAETGLDIADVARTDGNPSIDHYGADSSVLSEVQSSQLNGSGFKLLDFTQNRERYGRLKVVEDAMSFSHEGQRYFAYCREGRVFVRKRWLLEKPRQRLGGSKIGLTVMGTGMVIELKEKAPKWCDADAMDLIMFRAKEGSKLGLWVWSKILSGNIRYKPTEDSCMWNRDASSEDATVTGRWSVPRWVLQYMLVMENRQNVQGNDNVHRDEILVQAGDDMPLFRLFDNGRTRYNCERVSSSEVRRLEHRKAFFEPSMSCAGANHPLRTRQSDVS
ncbi:hypothetical protein BWQ96_09456 [Gracilariopsis chorda]|uniref:Uncharacterized protein n=1 Tax=Gracilariopsis chorda TaxID=448386 RepID=A0A2V3IFI1_9FLOR|nr:hypothetical protein BWQ96_09456 [Gracilariopsis chorda]|eukprot:PXF40834.1 hypothetical protein BWQ96_09456 [Gracilariopsis chorda]